MSDVTPFNFEDHPVRVVMLDDEPWFVVTDVCRALEIVDARQAAQRIDEADRCQTPLGRNGQVAPVPTWVVNESGLYELVFGSNKPEARRFRRWITSEVLPQIRKTGSYSAKPMSALDVFASAVAALQEQERRTAAVERRQDAIELALEQQAADVDTLKENHDRVSAIGYANLRKIRSDVDFLKRLGIKASALARRYGIPVSRVHSTVWGEVNAWPLDLWDEAYEVLRDKFGL